MGDECRNPQAVERARTQDQIDWTSRSHARLALATSAVRVGDRAPDFILPKLHIAPERKAGTAPVVRLYDFLSARPVALIFGSFTCPRFREHSDALHALYDQYRDRVSFFVIYIKEAHPEDGWALSRNRSSGIEVYDPESDAKRAEVATNCALRMSIRIPLLLDGIDNRVASTYGGWPGRYYLIARGGRIIFQSKEGPAGLVPESLGAALDRELSTEPVA